MTSGMASNNRDRHTPPRDKRLNPRRDFSPRTEERYAISRRAWEARQAELRIHEEKQRAYREKQRRIMEHDKKKKQRGRSRSRSNRTRSCSDSEPRAGTPRRSQSPREELLRRIERLEHSAKLRDAVDSPPEDIRPKIRQEPRPSGRSGREYSASRPHRDDDRHRHKAPRGNRDDDSSRRRESQPNRSSSKHRGQASRSQHDSKKQSHKYDKISSDWCKTCASLLNFCKCRHNDQRRPDARSSREIHGERCGGGNRSPPRNYPLTNLGPSTSGCNTHRGVRPYPSPELEQQSPVVYQPPPLPVVYQPPPQPVGQPPRPHQQVPYQNPNLQVANYAPSNRSVAHFENRFGPNRIDICMGTQVINVEIGGRLHEWFVTRTGRPPVDLPFWRRDWKSMPRRKEILLEDGSIWLPHIPPPSQNF